MRCWLGLHDPDPVAGIDTLQGVTVVVLVVVCARCGVRIWEEVHPLAELPQSDD